MFVCLVKHSGREATTASPQAAVELSVAQKQDLMHLRRLFYCKLGQLSHDRKQLLHQMAPDSVGLSTPGSTMSHRKQLTPQLAALDKEEQCTYMQFASAFFRGVRGFTCVVQAVTCLWCLLGAIKTAKARQDMSLPSIFALPLIMPCCSSTLACKHALSCAGCYVMCTLFALAIFLTGANSIAPSKAVMLEAVQACC